MNLSVGDFGYFEFTTKKKVFGTTIEKLDKIYGYIREINELKIDIEDSFDKDIHYKPDKSRIIIFEKQDKPNEK